MNTGRRYRHAQDQKYKYHGCSHFPAVLNHGHNVHREQQIGWASKFEDCQPIPICHWRTKPIFGREGRGGLQLCARGWHGLLHCAPNQPHFHVAMLSRPCRSQKVGETGALVGESGTGGMPAPACGRGEVLVLCLGPAGPVKLNAVVSCVSRVRAYDCRVFQILAPRTPQPSAWL